MESPQVSPEHRWKRVVISPSFWIIVAVLVATTLLHYHTPQIRVLPSPLNAFLSRHAVERILFILPIAVATFTLGRGGGLIALALAIAAMVPRALWLSLSPVDALAETVATAVVGYLVIWMIESQARE